jgi:acyl-CoA synthetase (AMP-forming)/AMP-acid ligase II
VNIREGLKPLLDLADPRTMMRLYRAGTITPKTPLAVGLSLPWLIGRGPSLGVVSQMNSLVLGSKPAIVDRNGTIGFRELDVNANRFAQALRRFGLEAGDRICLVLRNTREFAEVILGGQKAGIASCPLNTWAKPNELRATLEQYDSKLLLYDTAHAEQVDACDIRDIPLVFVGSEAEALPASIAYRDFLTSGSALPPLPFTRDRGTPKVIIHTSGTTGTPKGAQRDAAAAGLGSLANLLSIVPYRRDDIIACPAPLFHSFGLATLTFATALGASLVLPEKFDAEGSLALIEEHKATAASFVPVMIRRVLNLDHDVKARYDLSSLRIVLASGSAMSPELRTAAMDLFGETLYDLYGSTEAGWVAIASPQDVRQRPKSVGRPVPGIEAAVFSVDGKRLGSNEPGELFVRSGIVFEGYTSGDAKKERDGFMSLGDLGYIDDDGYLFVEGRADDMVVVGGENVYPVEVEEVIESIAGVKEAAVIGQEDPEFGHVLAAFVSGSATKEQIQEVCRDKLASFKVPRRIEIVDELPRTSTGKVLKRELS